MMIFFFLNMIFLKLFFYFFISEKNIKLHKKRVTNSLVQVKSYSC